MSRLEKLNLSKAAHIQSSTINLTASKSEANRALIIRALAGAKEPIHNIAKARDTETMQRLLSDEENPVWDVLDAGTTMRFTTAYAAVKGLPKLMTGTKRMTERPIGILVDALKELGAEISYQNERGYPPHKIEGFKGSGTNHIKIRGDVSSQYISALLMIAPSLPKGLSLELTGKIGSKPYILMTLNLMKEFGVDSEWRQNIITVQPQAYISKEFTVEADWSAASYWYSIVALSANAEIRLLGLKEKSNQGDSVLSGFMTQLGVKSEFFEGGVKLSKCDHKESFEWDFTNCPDIAQTVAVICAVKGIKAKFLGLESLRIKETDRINAIRDELKKFGIVVGVEGDEIITIQGKQSFDFNSKVEIETYHDHRMAMAFAPLAVMRDITILDPSVVNKSYPDYWKDLSSIGLK